MESTIDKALITTNFFSQPTNRGIYVLSLILVKIIFFILQLLPSNNFSLLIIILIEYIIILIIDYKRLIDFLSKKKSLLLLCIPLLCHLIYLYFNFTLQPILKLEPSVIKSVLITQTLIQLIFTLFLILIPSKVVQNKIKNERILKTLGAIILIIVGVFIFINGAGTIIQRPLSIIILILGVYLIKDLFFNDKQVEKI